MERHFLSDTGQLMQILDNLKLFEEIKLEEMPEYRLYISQLEEFFDKKLGKSTNDDEERKIISRTMIQNYIKDGLLMPPEGKSYNRNHVILLTLIYNLKPILSIKDIRKLLSPILNDIEDEDGLTDIQYLYNTYLRLNETALSNFSVSLAENFKRIKSKPKMEEKSDSEWERIMLLLLVVTLVSEANVRKKLAEHIIDKFFTLEDNKEES